MDGVRSVSIGLGKFFDELYPAQTGGKANGGGKTAAPTAKPR